MSGISTHVLDLTLGKPAAGVTVRLSKEEGGSWTEVSTRRTDADGRVKSMLRENEPLERGTYRLRFDTASYFQAKAIAALHPFVEIVFEIRNSGEHHHIPLLVTPHSYSTYRGS